MENKALEEIISTVISELLDKMGFSCELEMIHEVEKDKENLVCNIKTEESSFLIGQHGINLQSLQHIARVLARKKTDDKINFILDVNNYRQEKNTSIINLAKDIADQVLGEKRAIVLRPMSAYERRLVHMELAKNPLIKTESIGEGENRKVVVKPSDAV